MADAAVSAPPAGAQETYSITLPVREYRPTHFRLDVDGKTAVITLNRPERKNPLTFHSYAELRDLFRALQFDEEVKDGSRDRRRRQFLLGRRRLRDHRAAPVARYAGAAAVSPV